MGSMGTGRELETAGKMELSGLIVVRLDKSIEVKTPLGHKGGGDCYRIGLYFLPKSYLRVGGLWV